ncbi:MAG: hypothetical protein OIF40_03155 [Mangrovicoccus sp.]|nr:hypothetical protein [Mangrovicoccus sp.]
MTCHPNGNFTPHPDFETVGEANVRNWHDELIHVSIALDDQGELAYGKLHFGGSKAIGDGELYDTISGALNIYRGDNDVQDLLTELLLGMNDGDCPDGLSDGVAGIDGVKLLGLDSNSFTIQLTNAHGATDTMVFSGAGVEKILEDVAAMSNQIDIADNSHQFAIIDAAALEACFASYDIGTPSGELAQIIGYNGISAGGFFLPDDVLELLSEFFTGQYSWWDFCETIPGIDGVELIDVDADSFAFSVNGDTILITNAGDQIAAASSQAVLHDGVPSAELVDQTETHLPGSYIGKAKTVGDGELKDVIGHSRINLNNNVDDVENLILAFTTSAHSDADPAGIDGVELVGLDEDSVTFVANGDTIILQHDYFDLA